MRTIVIFMLLYCCGLLSAQDIEKPLLKSKDFYISGSIGVSGRLFNSSDPLAYNNTSRGYMANARLNIHYGKIVLPFSYRLGDQLNLPNLPSFQYWGFSPRYKGVQVHLGHRSLRYSDNTLAGLQTYGAALELDFGNFSFQVGRGILNRGRPMRTVYNSQIGTQNERSYTAGSIQYGKRKNFIQLSVLSAQDTENGAIDSLPRRYNAVAEVSASKQLFSVIRLKGSLAGSYTDNETDNFVNLLQDQGYGKGFANILGRDLNNSSKVGFLFNGQIALDLPKFLLGFSYDKVDLGFESFGRIFQLTDIETYTVDNKLVLFKQKLIVTSKVGVQTNNNRDQKASNSKRLISNASILLQASQHVGFHANYSNFNLEKENLYIVGQDSFSFSYNALNLSFSPFIRKDKTNWTGMFNYTATGNSLVREGFDPNLKMYSVNLNLEREMFSENTMLVLGVNHTRLSGSQLLDNTYGFESGVSMTFGEEKCQTRVVYNLNKFTRSADGENWIHGINAQINYRLNGLQNLAFNLNYRNRKGDSPLNENQIRLSYQYRFNTKKTNKNEK